jgi:enamine deaminase RidA (YjgF/YER057c/UK114 family)
MAPEYQTLELERAGPVLRVWLNRPVRRNAVSPRMLSELGDLYLSLETDFDARVVVLGGRGASFCAGADRKAPLPEEALPPPRSERERRWLSHLDQGYQAARSSGLKILAAVRAALGSLDRVKRVVKVHGMVNSAPGFTDQPKVINGFSDLMVEVFGEAIGKHARAAVGMAELPSDIPVEIEVILEVE